MFIFLKFVIADTVALEWKPHHSIKDIWNYISDQLDLNLFSDRIILIFNDTEMEESKNLKDYGIVNQNAMVQVVLEGLFDNKIDTEVIRIKVKQMSKRVNKLRIQRYFHIGNCGVYMWDIGYNFRTSYNFYELFDINVLNITPYCDRNLPNNSLAWNDSKYPMEEREYEEINSERELEEIHRERKQLNTYRNKSKIDASNIYMKNKKLMHKQMNKQMKNNWKLTKGIGNKQNFKNKFQKNYR